MQRRTVIKLAVVVVVLGVAGTTAYALRHVVSRAIANHTDVTSQTATAARITRPNAQRLRLAVRDGKPITVVGIGSSVGVGAELTDPAVQSPVGHLAGLLRARYASGTVHATNLSVDGSTAFDGVKVYTSEVRPLHPTVLLIAFGMNDGQPAEFNSGETLTGSISALRQIIEMARADGTTVLVATTPSPDTDGNDFTLPAGIPIEYPNVGGPLVPSPAHAVTTIDGEPFSARHATWNAEVRTLVKNEHVTLLDVAKYWSAAERKYGQAKLFNVQNGPADPGRFVHPNLLGHQASYWAAEGVVVAGLVPQ